MCLRRALAIRPTPRTAAWRPITRARATGSLISLLPCSVSRPRSTLRPALKWKKPQDHQIDVAWPAREHDVLVCAEGLKSRERHRAVTLASTVPSPTTQTGVRRSKFAATDLKLGRREQREEIRNWRSWRSHATPQTYFLWAARLASGHVNSRKTQRLTGKDRIERLTREAKSLVDTYIDGAGLFAWQLNATGTAYEEVPLPKTERVTSVDEMLDYIASEINGMAKLPGAQATPPA